MITIKWCRKGFETTTSTTSEFDDSQTYELTYADTTPHLPQETEENRPKPNNYDLNQKMKDNFHWKSRKNKPF